MIQKYDILNNNNTDVMTTTQHLVFQLSLVPFAFFECMRVRRLFASLGVFKYCLHNERQWISFLLAKQNATSTRARFYENNAKLIMLMISIIDGRR